MKPFALVLLLLAGAALATIALRTPEPDYVAPTADEPPPAVPFTLPAELLAAPPAGTRVRTFEVEGICCEGCAGKLSEALATVEGVDQVAVDSVTGRVQVLASETQDDAVLARALTFDEYEAHLLP